MSFSCTTSCSPFRTRCGSYGSRRRDRVCLPYDLFIFQHNNFTKLEVIYLFFLNRYFFLFSFIPNLVGEQARLSIKNADQNSTPFKHTCLHGLVQQCASILSATRALKPWLGSVSLVWWWVFGTSQNSFSSLANWDNNRVDALYSGKRTVRFLLIALWVLQVAVYCYFLSTSIRTSLVHIVW